MKARLAGPARAGTLAATLVLAAFALLGLAGTPAPVRGMGPLPACRYDDILTSPRDYNDWSATLVDTILRVARDYVPPDLVDVSQADIGGKGLVRAIVIDDLRAMTEAAAAADAPIEVESAYRSYEKQQVVFKGWVNYYGYKRALEVSARPGHSEHQLGLTIDFRTAGGGDPFSGHWQESAAGKWMKAHAWEYGWVMSYPRGMIDVTCYDFEPWHFRYVGRDLAASIHGSGLTPREYLWANFTTTVVPARTPRPGHTAQPTETPPSTVEPSVAPTLGASVPPPTSPALTPPPTQPAATAAPATDAQAVPSLPPTGVVVDIEPAAAGIAIVAAALAVALALLARKVLRRGRSAVGL